MQHDDEDDDEGLWRPPWETQEDEPPGPPRQRQPAVEPDYTHPLLTPLARAQDAVARQEAHAGAASTAVAEGLRARMSYREAAGWLSHAHVWIHPQDLALRDAGLTGSYGAAARLGRIESELPATAAHGADFGAMPFNLGIDVQVDLALRFARLWRRLAEYGTWTPLTDAVSVQETLQSLGFRGETTDAGTWLASVHAREEGPPLIRAGRAARSWINRPGGSDPLSLDGMFFAACLWREKGFGRTVSLPFWSAGEQRHHRLSLRAGPPAISRGKGPRTCPDHALQAPCRAGSPPTRTNHHGARSRWELGCNATGGAWAASPTPGGRDHPGSNGPRIVAGVYPVLEVAHPR